MERGILLPHAGSDHWSGGASRRMIGTPARAVGCLSPALRLSLNPTMPSQTMSQDDKLIDLNAERAKRVHDLNEKRLNEVRQAFEQAMPLGKAKKKPKNKPKKR
jgi:hypothetical protein